MKPHLCFVVSSEMTARSFLLDHIAAVKDDFLVTLSANTSSFDFLPADIHSHSNSVVRQISIVKDVRALFALWRFFRSERFVIVHSVTPKAGLLAMIAARLAGVPFRFHTFTGQVWATKTGLRRFTIKTVDRVIAAMASHLLVDSPSQRDFLINEGVFLKQKSFVLGDGSITGVDVHRFRQNPQSRTDVRIELDLDPDDVVLLFVGRLQVDKGVLDLADAFKLLKIEQNERRVALVFVGPDEQHLEEQIRTRAGAGRSDTRFVGMSPYPEKYMAAADIFCLPSYREGFGMVAIEAAASGLPVVASRIYGITDAVSDEVTGYLHEVRNPIDIKDKLLPLIDDSVLRARIGLAGANRSKELFSKERLTSALLSFYCESMQRKIQPE